MLPDSSSDGQSMLTASPAAPPMPAPSLFDRFALPSLPFGISSSASPEKQPRAPPQVDTSVASKSFFQRTRDKDANQRRRPSIYWPDEPTRTAGPVDSGQSIEWLEERVAENSHRAAGCRKDERVLCTQDRQQFTPTSTVKATRWLWRVQRRSARGFALPCERTEKTSAECTGTDEHHCVGPIRRRATAVSRKSKWLQRLQQWSTRHLGLKFEQQFR
jgi:hypothetical protein